MLRRKCVFCCNIYDVRPAGQCDDSGRNRVEWRGDPFAEEIKGDFTKMWLCDDCVDRSAMEI